ncbi:MAG: universal stress protein [Myxococcales bacterium]|nr:MAG: universal stress protein [Myxococcales bacterium]
MATTSVDGKPYIIVVGVDFSEASELAAHRAFDLAAERELAELHLVNVVQTYGPQVAYEMPVDASALTVLTVAEARARFKTYADQALARFTADNPKKRTPRVFTHVRFDSVADEIAQLSADLEADLVVVGTHGRRGLSRMLLGSSAEATVRLAPCPVLVVRPKAVPDSPPRIEPPCPDCVAARRATGGTEMWCERHRDRHGQRHTYFQRDRTSSDAEMPLIMRQ